MSPSEPDPFEAWFTALEARHLAELTFPEVRRALQALSSLYVERRGKLASGAALEGAGKRAAFALFYGPLHFLLVRAIVRSVGPGAAAPSCLLDLGCGTGASGAAWALECGRKPALLGVDRNPWTMQEARWTYRFLGLQGEARCGDQGRTRMPGRGAGILAAFLANELEPGDRDRLLERLMEASRRGASVLVVEPLARRAAPWWECWSAEFLRAGGREDTWGFPAHLPERLRDLDRAAGLDHHDLTGRSLWIENSPPAP